jgi:hypothetical protein
MALIIQSNFSPPRLVYTRVPSPFLFLQYLVRLLLKLSQYCMTLGGQNTVEVEHIPTHFLLYILL